MTSDPTSEVTGGRYRKKTLFTCCFNTGPATDPSYGLQINSIALNSFNGLDLNSMAAGDHIYLNISQILNFCKFLIQIYIFQHRKLKLDMQPNPIGAEVMGYLRSGSTASEAV